MELAMCCIFLFNECKASEKCLEASEWSENFMMSDNPVCVRNKYKYCFVINKM